MSTSTRKVQRLTSDQLLAHYAKPRYTAGSEKTMQDVEARIQADLERTIKNAREQAATEAINASLARQALMTLDSIEGITLKTYCWSSSWVQASLGFVPNTRKARRQLADKLREIRRALGTSLGKPDMELSDADQKVVSFTFQPTDWPGLSIVFYRRMPAGQKCRCKIVRERSISTRLVCEVAPR